MFFTVVKIGGLLISVVALVYAFNRVKHTSAPSDHWLLPFARLSFCTWLAWILQYFILPGPSASAPTGYTLVTGLWLGVVQNVLWISAAFTLYSKWYPRLTSRLLLLTAFPIFVLFVLGTYRIGILTSFYFVAVEVLATGLGFVILAYSIWQLRIGRIYVVMFSLHGCTQFLWRSLWSPLLVGKWVAIYWTFPVWHIVLLLAWIKFISATVPRARSSEERTSVLKTEVILVIFLSIFLTILLRLLLENTWPYLKDIRQLWWFTPLGTAVVFVVGVVLFQFKKRYQLVYGLSEIGVALVIIWLNVVKTKTTVDAASLIAITGGAYLIVRGLT